MLNLQDFLSYFPDLPEHYNVALYDLYQQVSIAYVDHPNRLCNAPPVTYLFFVIGSSSNPSKCRGKLQMVSTLVVS